MQKLLHALLLMSAEREETHGGSTEEEGDVSELQTRPLQEEGGAGGSMREV